MYWVNFMVSRCPEFTVPILPAWSNIWKGLKGKRSWKSAVKCFFNSVAFNWP